MRDFIALLVTLFLLSVMLSDKIALAEPSLSTTGPCSPNVTGSRSEVSIKCYIVDGNFGRSIKLTESGRRLFVTEIWLVPSDGPLIIESGKGHVGIGDVFFVRFKVRNITATPVLLTAARLDIIGTRHAVKRGLTIGEAVLSPFISENKPVLLNPGQEALLRLSEGIYVDGLTDAIESGLDLSNATLIADGMEIARINGDWYLNGFRSILDKILGRSAALHLSIYEGDYRKVFEANVGLSQGSNYFYRGEEINRETGVVRYSLRVSHDVYLGEYLKRKELWEPGFHIKQPSQRCIRVTPDANVPGGMRYEDEACSSAGNTVRIVPQAEISRTGS